MPRHAMPWLQAPNVKLFNAVCAEDLIVKPDEDARGGKRVAGAVGAPRAAAAGPASRQQGTESMAVCMHTCLAGGGGLPPPCQARMHTVPQAGAAKRCALLTDGMATAPV